MSFVLRTAIKDWDRQRRDPLSFVVWLGIPLLVGGLLILASGGKEGPKPQAHVLIADRDDSFLSGFLVGALTQEEAGGFVRAEKVDVDEGRKRIRDGEATALLVIPAGFADGVLRETPVQLSLVTNPTQRILPGIVEESLSIFVDAVFYLHRFLGDELRELANGPSEGNTFSDAWVADVSVRVNRLVASLEDTLFPPVIELAFSPEEGEGAADAAAAAEPEQSMAELFVPGLLFMSFLFIAQGLAADLWQEREQNTLRRIANSPRTSVEFLAGKLVAGAGVILLVAAVALSAGFAYFDQAWSRLPLAVLWGTFSGIVLLVMMMLLQLFSASQRAGNVLTMVLVFPLMMMGGSFFPFEAMPAGLRSIGAWTPNGWALIHLKDILDGTESVPSLVGAFAGLLAVTSGLFLASARRMPAFSRGGP